MYGNSPDGLAEKVKRLNLQIAIDGPSGAGKSTIAVRLAAALSCPYLDTGLMYRAVTLRALDAGVSTDSSPALAEIARELDFTLRPDPVDALLVDGQVPGDELRSPRVDAAVSAVSAHPEVRDVLVGEQRAFATRRPIVMVGRDIGTVVLPEAPVKLWITASPAVRAGRRQRERTSAGEQAGIVAPQMTARDARDAARAVSPAQPAKDAVVLNTDGLSVDEVAHRSFETVASVVDRLESCAQHRRTS